MTSTVYNNVNEVVCPRVQVQPMITEHAATNRSIGGDTSLATCRASWHDHQADILAELQIFSGNGDLNVRGVAQNTSDDVQRGAKPEPFDSRMITEKQVGTGSSTFSQPSDSNRPTLTGLQRTASRLSLSSGAPLMAASWPSWTGVQGTVINEGEHWPSPSVCTRQPRNAVFHMLDSAGEGVYRMHSLDSKLIPWGHLSGGAGLPFSVSLAQAPPLESTSASRISTSTILPSHPISSPLSWACGQQQSTAGSGGNTATLLPPLVMHDVPAAADDVGYEPHNSSILTKPRVGSLDRVFCALHSKERTAQNMVLVRTKRTNVMHWRCKHSCQCKVGHADRDWVVGDNQSASPVSVADIIPHSQPDVVPVMSPGTALPVSMCFWNRCSGISQYALVVPLNTSAPQGVEPPVLHPTMNVSCQNILPGTNSIVAHADSTLKAPSSTRIAAPCVYYPLCTQGDLSSPLPLQQFSKVAHPQLSSVSCLPYYMHIRYSP